MKIAICTNHFHPFIGGSEIVCGELASYLCSSHDVCVITRQTPKRVGLKYPYKVAEYSPSSLRTFLNALTQIKPDILFVYGDVFDFLPSALSYDGKIIFAPVGGTRLQSDPSKMTMFYRSMDKIKTIICHSRHIEDYRICQSAKLFEKTIIIPNAVRPEEFNTSMPKRDDFGEQIKNRKWILNVSNFFPGKNQEEIINILDRHPNPESLAYFQVCSDIEFPIGQTLEAKWRLMSQKLKNKGMHVQLIKNAERQSVVDMFRMSDVFVFTSIKEVTPIVILESMATGLPWISADVGDTPDLKGGIVIKTPKNSSGQSMFDNNIRDRFIEGIKSLISNPSIGDLGYAQVVDEYNLSSILPRYERIFLNVYEQD